MRMRQRELGTKGRVLAGAQAVHHVDNALSDDVIDTLLREIEPLMEVEAAKSIHQRARTSTTPSGRTFQDYRLNLQVDQDNAPLASLLWSSISPTLPKQYAENWIPASINERMRIVRYEKGERTTIHTDGSFQRSWDEKSLLTLMVYLNDGCQGGHTRFYDPEAAGGGEEEGEEGDPWFLQVVPKKGKALWFDHEVVHEGSEVLGGVKYILRTDIMCTYQKLEK